MSICFCFYFYFYILNFVYLKSVGKDYNSNHKLGKKTFST